MSYKGPLRDEPLAIELHNTVYATSAGVVDALADDDGAVAWLEALAPRLALAGAPEGAWPNAAELRALRGAVRVALRAAVPAGCNGGEGASTAAGGSGDEATPTSAGGSGDEATPSSAGSSGDEGAPATAHGSAKVRAAIDAINLASRHSPRSPRADCQDGAPPALGTDFHGASRAHVVLGALAGDAIELLTSPHREQLRLCGAPGCVLMFLKEHPRREWCSDGCGNRARQARHYARTRHRDAR